MLPVLEAMVFPGVVDRRDMGKAIRAGNQPGPALSPRQKFSGAFFQESTRSLSLARLALARHRACEDIDPAVVCRSQISLPHRPSFL
jgi:hypothetical protein